LGTRDGDSYKWISFRDGIEQAETLSAGIVDMDLCPKQNVEEEDWNFMGIMSINRPEWALTHFAGMHQSITTVPLYETLGQDAIKYIIDQTQLTTISIAPKNLDLLLKMKKEDDSSLT
jgi:long-chain acyl-CoA synthetase